MREGVENFLPKNFAEWLVDTGVLKFPTEPVKLAGGETARWYADMRILMSKEGSVLVTKQNAAIYVKKFLEEKGLLRDCVGVVGVPEGATQAGIAISEELIASGAFADDLYSLRKLSKKHGMPGAESDWLSSTAPDSDKGFILFEDVTTTGGSVLKRAEELRSQGKHIIAIVSFLDRSDVSDDGVSKATKAMQAAGFGYYPMTTKQELFGAALQHPQLPEHAHALIEKELSQD